MGIAALVIGIVSLLIAWIPCIGIIAIIPALVGLVLGIVDIVNKSKKKEPISIGVAGTICCGVSLICIVLSLDLMCNLLFYRFKKMETKKCSVKVLHILQCSTSLN